MKLNKWKAIVFMQIANALIFILIGFMYYNDESEYRNIILSVCFIGFLASVYVVIRVYRNNNPKP
mgnify:CR=1 FL=1